MAELVSSTPSKRYGPEWVNHLKQLRDPCPSWAARLLSEARKRSKLKGTACTLTRADMLALVERSGGRCELSGIPFNHDKAGTRRAFGPSLDRIDCGLGYVPGNVRLVVYAVNAAMNEWGFDTLLAVARGVVGKHG